MMFIAHRINTISALKELPEGFGLEVDLRDHDGRLILQHDPFTEGEDFEEFLKFYKHSLIILNIKSERIEWRVLELLNKYSVTDYFFLDSSFPMIYQLSEKGESNTALRFSEFEGIDTLVTMQVRAKWVWVDCFTKLPLNDDIYKRIKALGYKICLVSPELQGRPHEIITYKDYLEDEKIFLDAVCTKQVNFDKWLPHVKLQQESGI
jgi:hypothetical protein